MAIVSATSALPENQGNISTYLWDTSALGSGDYYVYGIVYGGTQTFRAYASGRVRVNHPPTIMLVNPDIGDASQEATFRITWTDWDDGDNAYNSRTTNVTNWTKGGEGGGGESLLGGLREIRGAPVTVRL